MLKFFSLMMFLGLVGSPDIADSSDPSCKELLGILSQNVSRCMSDDDWDKNSSEGLNILNKPSTGAVDLPNLNDTGENWCQVTISGDISNLINTCKDNDFWDKIKECAEKLLLMRTYTVTDEVDCLDNEQNSVAATLINF